MANAELQSDLKDLAVQNGFRIGLNPLATEQDLRDSVIAKARDHGIQLEPRQVAVQRSFDGDLLSVSLTADYQVRVNLLGYRYSLHFTPSSHYSQKIIAK